MSIQYTLTRLGYTIILGVIFLSLSIILLTTPLIYAATRVIQVSETGSNTSNCGSALHPCRTIKHVVESLAQVGDEIQVSAGVYTETFRIITQGLKIYGAGADQTFIDGQNLRGPMVTFGPGLTRSTVFSGFTIHQGRAITNGGAMLLSVTSPTIQFTTIQDNAALAGLGGGIYLQDSAPIIRASRLQYNEALTGGGLYVAGNSMPVVQQNTICANQGTQLVQVGSGQVDARGNWWGTNIPQIGATYTGVVEVEPVALASIGTVSSGTLNLPPVVGQAAQLAIAISANGFSPPPDMTVQISADFPIFLNTATTTHLLITKGQGITTIIPTVAGTNIISVFDNCNISQPITTFIVNVQPAAKYDIYLPVTLKKSDKL